jgi:hypothetical protein
MLPVSSKLFRSQPGEAESSWGRRAARLSEHAARASPPPSPTSWSRTIAASRSSLPRPPSTGKGLGTERKDQPSASHQHGRSTPPRFSLPSNCRADIGAIRQRPRIRCGGLQFGGELGWMDPPRRRCSWPWEFPDA